MRAARLLPLLALVGCTTGDLLGTPDASTDDAGLEDAPADVPAAPDAGADVAPIDATVLDAPMDVLDSGATTEAAPPPPLWWEQTTKGSIVFSESVDSSLDVLVGGGDLYLEEYDALGNPIWKLKPAVTNQSSGDFTSVAFDHAGAMIAAASLYGTVDVGGGNLASQGGAFLVKYDASGTYQWQAGPFGATISSIAIDSQNRIVACGSLDGTTDFGQGSVSPNGGADALVMRFAPSGSIDVEHHYGDSAIQRVHRCVIDGSDGVVAIGAFEGTADFGGGPLSGAPQGSFSNYGGAAIFVARFDASLAYSHALEFSSQTASAVALALDASGNVVYGGSTGGPIDLGNGQLTPTNSYAGFAGQLTSSLGYTWGKLYDNASFLAIAADGTGPMMFAGGFTKTADVGCGAMTAQQNQVAAFFARIDATGACKTKSVANEAWPLDLAFMEQNDWVTAGSYSGTATFPGLPTFGGGCNGCSSDGFIVRFAP